MSDILTRNEPFSHAVEAYRDSGESGFVHSLQRGRCVSTWDMIVQNVRMRTVLLSMCPTAGPLARGARRDIPGNSLGHGSTSTSRLAYVWGAYGAPTLCRRRAADGRRELAVDVI